MHIQMAFLFSILWGLCCTLTSGAKQQFDAFFRNLVDGLMKGHTKPASFRSVFRLCCDCRLWVCCMYLCTSFCCSFQWSFSAF